MTTDKELESKGQKSILEKSYFVSPGAYFSGASTCLWAFEKMSQIRARTGAWSTKAVKSQRGQASNTEHWDNGKSHCFDVPCHSGSSRGHPELAPHDHARTRGPDLQLVVTDLQSQDEAESRERRGGR